MWINNGLQKNEFYKDMRRGKGGQFSIKDQNLESKCISHYTLLVFEKIKKQ